MMEDNEKKIEALNKLLKNKFATSSVALKSIEDVARNKYGEDIQEGSFIRILDNEEFSFCKAGIYDSNEGKSYYALICSLDENGFDSEEEMEETRQKLQNGEIEAHDLSMDQLETGLLYQYDPETESWSLHQEDHDITSYQDFTFVTEKEFFDNLLFERDTKEENLNNDNGSNDHGL